MEFLYKLGELLKYKIYYISKGLFYSKKFFRLIKMK